MHKIKINAITLFLALSIALSALPTMVQRIQAASPSNETTFSIMQISDMQHLAYLNPQLYTDTASWIVNNSANHNLKMVVYTGDFVDAFVTNPPPPPMVMYNASQLAQEWAVANAAMSKLLDANIPYCWDAGNHDQTPWGNPDGLSVLSGYMALNASYMRSKPYWVSDIFDSKNTAAKFTFNNYLFMIINLEYRANNSVISWMRALLDENPAANVIVATHGYLNAKAGYGSTNPLIGDSEITWAQAFKETLDSYPNIFLALCGHISGANTTRVGNRQEILFCPQDVNNQLGSASVRIYSFNPTSKTVNASTYSVDTKTWRTDASNQFDFGISSTTIPEFAGQIFFVTFAALVAVTFTLILGKTGRVKKFL